MVGAVGMKGVRDEDSAARFAFAAQAVRASATKIIIGKRTILGNRISSGNDARLYKFPSFVD
jgi:hypothetical protein